MPGCFGVECVGGHTGDQHLLRAGQSDDVLRAGGTVDEGKLFRWIGDVGRGRRGAESQTDYGREHRHDNSRKEARSTRHENSTIA